MAKRAATKTTDQYTHPSAKRANLPTEQTGKTMSDTDRQPILHIPATPRGRRRTDTRLEPPTRQPRRSRRASPIRAREKSTPQPSSNSSKAAANSPNCSRTSTDCPPPTPPTSGTNTQPTGPTDSSTANRRESWHRSSHARTWQAKSR